MIDVRLTFSPKIIYYRFVHLLVPNWIFVITSDYKEFERRIKENMWPIFTATAHKNDLKSGDRIIFYKGGHEGQKFLGRAKLASRLKHLGELSHYVALADIEVWKNPPLIRPMIPELAFIIRKDRWGIHLQGGVITLSDKDYDYISAKSR